MRLNQFLARCGLGSRRGVERLILEGRVTVNGSIQNRLAKHVEEGDAVALDGRPVRPSSSLTVLLHKPRGFLCTSFDLRGRQTVYDLLPPRWRNLRYVGRLDRDSEGLLLFTSDGSLIQRLAHPRHQIPKVYEVECNAPADVSRIAILLRGCRLQGRVVSLDSFELLGSRRVRVVVHQGLKRQIRLMFQSIGYEVVRLVRVGYGPLSLGSLGSGRYRLLSGAEIAALLQPSFPARPESRARRRSHSV
ncbi:Ribosomal large subunit pseudouridine synthase B [Methylacidimicrobium cyclopophantes]|uniref:Pseudouridine synthase n=1 Tax=Methylacidimicrobium cyclopophantes TaxID=1041766 RepID=A0A5E6MGC4_9BACT|nr:pseudouridine synthase [Methylacidimicrobium cyclopophantes]VVM05119.1 Ribosomal large subunit pseudouridine synthase B [Methylacidimicrobium cyclopophantes]